MTTRNKRKLAALNKENYEEHPRSNLAQNSNAPRSQEDYITQISEEIEGKVTKKLSKEFSRTENRILGALARLDGFLMNPLLQGHSGGLSEPIEYKPGNEWGRLPEWSSSWSGPLPQPDYAKLWPRRRPWQMLPLTLEILALFNWPHSQPMGPGSFWVLLSSAVRHFCICGWKTIGLASL